MVEHQLAAQTHWSRREHSTRQHQPHGAAWCRVTLTRKYDVIPGRAVNLSATRSTRKYNFKHRTQPLRYFYAATVLRCIRRLYYHLFDVRVCTAVEHEPLKWTTGSRVNGRREADAPLCVDALDSYRYDVSWQSSWTEWSAES